MKLIVDLQKQLPNYCLEVSFTVEGDALGILGSSGAGKSMALRCIAGIETPTSGTIVLNDRLLYDSRKGINLPSRDRNVGFLFQNYALFPHLTVAQNVAYGLKGLSTNAIARRVTAQLEQVKLVGLGDRYPHQLSGGQQQRVRWHGHWQLTLMCCCWMSRFPLSIPIYAVNSKSNSSKR
jgi:molybdate transport system permease protein